MASWEKEKGKRFIILLDSVYEARCLLLLQAQVSTSTIHSFQKRRAIEQTDGRKTLTMATCAKRPFSKIYQDTNLPFRPNTSGYDGEQRNLAEYEFREPSNPSESKREHNFFGLTTDAMIHRPTVQKMTVYRKINFRYQHRPTETRLYTSCSLYRT